MGRPGSFDALAFFEVTDAAGNGLTDFFSANLRPYGGDMSCRQDNCRQERLQQHSIESDHKISRYGRSVSPILKGQTECGN